MSSRQLSINTEFRENRGGPGNFLSMRVAVVGQGNTTSTYSLDPRRVTSAGETASVYGFGSPLHLATRELLPENGDGIGGIPLWIYPLADSGSTADNGSIAISGTASDNGTITVKIAGMQANPIAIEKDELADAVAEKIKTAINAVLKMPVIAGTVAAGVLPLQAKWKGESGNYINIDVSVDVGGILSVVTPFSNGASNPDVSPALALFGEEWNTIVVNCLNYDDITALDDYQTSGETRWGRLVQKPFLTVSGTSDDRATRTAITDARKDDRINSLSPVPGSPNMPAVIAARAATRIAKQADENAPIDYAGELDTITPGTVAEQEDYVSRVASVDSGSGTTVLKNGIPKLNDVLTMWHPDTEETPAYRWVVDLVKIWNLLDRIAAVFNTDAWLTAALVNDGEVSANKDARKPSTAEAAMANIADIAALDALINDSAFTKANLNAEVDPSNSGQLNLLFPVILSGNARDIRITLEFAVL